MASFTAVINKESLCAFQKCLKHHDWHLLSVTCSFSCPLPGRELCAQVSVFLGRAFAFNVNSLLSPLDCSFKSPLLFGAMRLVCVLFAWGSSRFGVFWTFMHNLAVGSREPGLLAPDMSLVRWGYLHVVGHKLLCSATMAGALGSALVDGKSWKATKQERW